MRTKILPKVSWMICFKLIHYSIDFFYVNIIGLHSGVFYYSLRTQGT